MNCDESEILIHALLDGELDAGHAREVENHLAACPACAEKLKSFRALREAMVAAELKERAPAALRDRLEAVLGAAHRFLQRCHHLGHAVGADGAQPFDA